MNKIQAAIDRHYYRQRNIKDIKKLLPKQEYMIRHYKPVIDEINPDKSLKSVLIWGGTRSGKTVGVCLYVLMLMKNVPMLTVALTATTDGQAQLTLGQTLEDLLNLYCVKYERKTIARHTAFVLENGATAILAGYQGRGIDNLFMGVAVDVFVADEARHVKEEQHGKIYTRLSGTSDPKNRGKNKQMLIYITNPEGTDSWLYKYYIEQKKGVNILFPPQDNEANLPPGYFGAMENELPDFMVKRMIYSMWTQAEGACFPDLEADVLVDRFDDVIEFQCGGMDFGFQHDFAFGLVEITQNQTLVVRDTYSTNKTDQETQARNIVFILREFCGKIIKVYCDHDPQGQMQLEKLINSDKRRVKLENANKTHKGDVVVFLNRLIKRNKLKLIKTKGNRKLLKQMQNAVWDKDKPLKKEGIEDDSLDMLLYALSKIYDKPFYLKKLGLEKI